MSDHFTSTPFEMSGCFGGFVFTDVGKRRMVLRQGDTEFLLKAPKALRHRIIGKFRPGQTIRVAGVEERNPVTGSVRLIVSQVLPATAATDSPAPPIPQIVASSSIRVCAKKNCWRNGGRELSKALEREIDALGLSDRINLRLVSCLDRCHGAPNVDAGRHEYTRVSPSDAAAIVARAAGTASPQETIK